MPPIELGPTRPIGAVDVRIASQSSAARETVQRTETKAPATVALSDALKAGEAPVDVSRVAVIKKAVEAGQYPLFPAKIADAMIAAGILLQKGQ